MFFHVFPLMMLSETEKEHARVLLNGLNFTELHQLSKTITGSSLSLEPKDKTEAVEIIIKFEEDSTALLSRRKIKKELLCRYLHWSNVHFSLNAEKAALVKLIAELWKVPVVKSIERGREDFVEEGSCEASSDSEEPCSSVAVHQATTQIIMSPNSVEAMAVKFAEWFYKMVNEEFWGRNDDRLGGEHFFTDSQTVVRLINKEEQEEITAVGAEDGATLIRETRAKHALLLNPNLSPGIGVRGNTEPHGAVMVLACGTLHCAPDLCVGVFEQAFLLIKDPLADDNWKIKKTDLRLRNAPGTKSLPSLADGELSKQLALTG